MSGINSEIDAFTKEIEKSSEELNLLYEELGQKAVQWHKAIAYAPSYESYNKIIDIFTQKDSIAKEMEAVTSALTEVNSSDYEIRKTKQAVSDLRKNLRTLICSIGAVAAETQKAGKLPQKLTSYMKTYDNYRIQEQELLQKINNSKGIAKTFAQMQLKLHQGELETVFSTVGHEIFYSEYKELLPSDKAKALIAEALETENAIEMNSNTIDSKINAAGQAQTSLEQMGISGIENKHLKSLEAQDDALTLRLKTLFTEYGRILSAGIDTWLDLLAPEELKNSCYLIKDRQRRIRELKLNLELLNTEKDVEIHQAQTEQLASQLTHINSQLALLERQKTDIQIKLEEEKKAIEALREQQNIVASRF